MDVQVQASSICTVVWCLIYKYNLLYFYFICICMQILFIYTHLVQSEFTPFNYKHPKTVFKLAPGMFIDQGFEMGQTILRNAQMKVRIFLRFTSNNYRVIGIKVMRNLFRFAHYRPRHFIRNLYIKKEAFMPLNRLLLGI